MIHQQTLGGSSKLSDALDRLDRCFPSYQISTFSLKGNMGSFINQHNNLPRGMFATFMLSPSYPLQDSFTESINGQTSDESE